MREPLIVKVKAEETIGPLNDKQRKYVNNVLISGRHLLMPMNQILLPVHPNLGA